MKKIYEIPISVKVDLQMEEGILLSSVGVKETEKDGSESWVQKKHPIWD